MLRLAVDPSVSCVWSVTCNPSGPDTPFGTPVLALWDLFRCLTLAACLLILVTSPAAFGRCGEVGQRVRILAAILWTLQTITTEAIHLGDEASLRLLYNGGGAILFAYGIWRMRTEQPARHRDG